MRKKIKMPHQTKLTKEDFGFPRKTRGFSFVANINTNDDSPYLFAEYRDSRGRFFVCKLFKGSKKTLTYKQLRNELRSYKILNDLYDKNKSEIKNVFPNIKVPQLMLSYEGSNKIYFLIEKINGKSLNSQKGVSIVNVFSDIAGYFDYISCSIEKTSLDIKKRGALEYALLVHYYLIKAIRYYPSLTRRLIGSLLTVYIGLIYMAFDKNVKFVLRDVASKDNIFIKNQEISIIDLENLTLTNEVVFFTSVVFGQCYNKKFVDTILRSRLLKNITSNNRKTIILKALLIYSTLVELVEAKKEKEILPMESPLRIFDFAHTLNTNLFLSENLKYLDAFRIPKTLRGETL